MEIITGIIAFVEDNGKVLMIKRQKEPYTGYYAMLGGKIDFGEHPEQTAVREVLEEAGIETELVKVRGLLSELIKNHETKETETHLLMLVCELHPKSTNAVSSDEGEVSWIDIDSLHSRDDIVPSDLHIIDKIVKGEPGIPVHKSELLKKDQEYIIERFCK